MHLPQIALILWLSALTAIGGLATGALWKAGARLLRSLVCIAELPDVVRRLSDQLTALVERLDQVRDRVDRLENYLPHRGRSHE